MSMRLYFVGLVAVFFVGGAVGSVLSRDLARAQSHASAKKLEHPPENHPVEVPGITGYDVLEIVGRFSTEHFPGNGTTGLIVKDGQETDFIDVDKVTGEVTKDTQYLIRIHHGADAVVKPLFPDPILLPES